MMVDNILTLRHLLVKLYTLHRDASFHSNLRNPHNDNHYADDNDDNNDGHDEDIHNDDHIIFIMLMIITNIMSIMIITKIKNTMYISRPASWRIQGSTKLKRKPT